MTRRSGRAKRRRFDISGAAYAQPVVRSSAMVCRPMRLLRSSLREPALHFVLVGAALFALHATVAGDLEEEPARIVVDRAVRAELADATAHRRARPATEAEIEAAVDGWIDEEVLYREALARGLDRGDPRVRALVAYTMRSVLEAQTRVPEPSEAELRAYFEADAGRWARKPRIDFTHVFVEGDRKSTRLNSSHVKISYAVFCLK